jgi:GT2 family glycosyltransferase
MRVVVVDSASADGTVEFVRASYPEAEVHASPVNLGYSGGNNVGIRSAIAHGAHYVLIINPDGMVADDMVERLVAAMEHDPLVGMVSPKVLYAAGSEPSRRIWYAGATIEWERGRSPHIGFQEQDNGQYDVPRETGRPCGGTMLLRASALDKVGLIDERYFLYFEEVDWAVRFREAGYRIWYEPRAICWHNVSSSVGFEGNALYWYYMTRNNLLFMSKFGRQHWRSFRRYLWRSQSWPNLKEWITHPDSVGRRRIYATLKGYVDFALKRFGQRFG